MTAAAARWALAAGLAAALLGLASCNRFDDEQAGWWCRVDYSSGKTPYSSCSIHWFCESCAVEAPIAGDRARTGDFVTYDIWCDESVCSCDEQGKTTGSFKLGRFCDELDEELWSTLKGRRGPCGFAPLE